jgi:Predicted nucleotide-binding protein containing TIR-like domain
MTPKVFIGSSREAKPIADAIDANLQDDAFPKVWTSGVFDLSEATLSSLMREVGESDFAIFVFSTDDISVIRGKLLTVPRDNVVYELGLFSGALGPARCFFLVPADSEIHLPSDLAGLTAGRYRADRPGNDWSAAVNPFCSDVKRRMCKLGVRGQTEQDVLTELAIKYECCDWISAEHERVTKKDNLWEQMVTSCRAKPAHKRILLKTHRHGFYVALAAAIVAGPERADCDLILEAFPQKIPPAHAQHKILDAIFALKDRSLLNVDQQNKLANWATLMPRRDDNVNLRLDRFRR